MSKKLDAAQADAEKAYQQSWDEIRTSGQMRVEEQVWMPPWDVNDLVGFLQVGFDRGRDLTIQCFLKRKYFRKGHRERRNKDETTERNNSFLLHHDEHIHSLHGADNEHIRSRLLSEIRAIEVSLQARLKGVEIDGLPIIRHFDFRAALDEATSEE